MHVPEEKHLASELVSEDSERESRPIVRSSCSTVLKSKNIFNRKIRFFFWKKYAHIVSVMFVVLHI